MKIFTFLARFLIDDVMVQKRSSTSEGNKLLWRKNLDAEASIVAAAAAADMITIKYYSLSLLMHALAVNNKLAIPKSTYR